MRRKQIPADCPVHGHPEELSPRNHAMLALFRIVHNANGINETVLYYFCKDEALDFLTMYSQLKEIETIITQAKSVEVSE